MSAAENNVSNAIKSKIKKIIAALVVICNGQVKKIMNSSLKAKAVASTLKHLEEAFPSERRRAECIEEEKARKEAEEDKGKLVREKRSS